MGLGQVGAQLIAHGHEAHIDSGQEQDKAHEGVQDAYADLSHLPQGQSEADRLKHQKEHHDQAQGQ